MNIISVENNKNNIVKKANDIIKAKGELSSTAQKMLAMLISMVRSDDSEFQEYALSIESYRKEIGSKNKDTEFYVKQAEELMRNPFRIEKTLFNWCSKVDWGKVDGYIVFSIHNDLKPYLLDLRRNFTTYNLVNIMSLRGDYSPRLYEYLLMEWREFRGNYKKRHNKTPKSYTIELEIGWIREHFGISKGYLYADIKRQIIEVAKKQLKAKTDIQFDYTEEKIGRKVNSLKITIKDNDKGSNDYLVTLQSFIAYIRDKYKPDIINDVFPNIIKNQNDDFIRVDNKGKLYLASRGKIEDFDNIQSKKLWNWMYDLAKNGTEF